MSYTILLSHLNRPSSSLPIQSISASLAHFLASLLPTPLTAITVSSPLFNSPLSHVKLSVLFTTFRHAVHLTHKSLVDDQSAEGLGLLFSRGVKVRLGEWVAGVLKGLEGGMGVLKLACAGGVLLGLGDLEMGSGEAGRGRVENEVVVALAEVMELFESAQDGGDWEKEFQPVTERGEVDALSLALILASHSLLLIPTSKVRALSLPTLAHHLTSTITSAFQSGSFLDPLASSIKQKDEYKIHISPSSNLPTSLSVLCASPLYTSLAPLSKLTARVLSTLIESKPLVGLVEAGRTLTVLKGLAERVERLWKDGGLDLIDSESDIEPESRKVTRQIWTVLKTLLFTTLMIVESVLSTTVFVPPTSFSCASSLFPSPKTLSRLALQTLSHLSLVISQFGGVTISSTSSADFPELKRTFYIALDVLTSGREGDNDGAEEEFVKQLCAEDLEYGVKGKEKDGRSQLRQAKEAFALACIEQLVPILNEESLPMILKVCLPHLSDPSNREAFESAHSVVLGIFTTHAQTVRECKVNANWIHGPEDGGSSKRRSFFEILVPFYAGCLIDNSVSGRLSTPQLRLAFSALVRSASSGAHIPSSSPPVVDADSLALPQFCIDSVLSAIHSQSSISASPPSPSDVREHLHRLHLTLVSTLPSLPLQLIPRTLDSIQSIVLSLPLNTDGDDRRKELVEELFKEILENVGDREKEVAMRWWYEFREELMGVGNGKKERDKSLTPSRL